MISTPLYSPISCLLWHGSLLGLLWTYLMPRGAVHRGGPSPLPRHVILLLAQAPIFDTCPLGCEQGPCACTASPHTKMFILHLHHRVVDWCITQELDSILVGPIPQGANKFIFEVYTLTSYHLTLPGTHMLYRRLFVPPQFIDSVLIARLLRGSSLIMQSSSSPPDQPTNIDIN